MRRERKEKLILTLTLDLMKWVVSEMYICSTKFARHSLTLSSRVAPFPQEQPALRFDTVGNSQPTNDFFSPLEAALLDEVGNDDTDDEAESDEETDDVPTEQESTWVSLMKKATGTLMMGLSPATTKDELKESEHGVHSRRDSQSSFQSARSIESVSIGRRSAETTPTHSRQGSFRGELLTSHPGERGSFTRRTSMKKKRRRSSLGASAVSIKPVANPVLEKLEDGRTRI